MNDDQRGVTDEQAARLDRFATGMHKSRVEATAQLIEEGLRHAEFPAVEFRDSVVGRPQDFPAIGEALIRIWDQMGDIDWSDRVAFATRAQTQH